MPTPVSNARSCLAAEAAAALDDGVAVARRRAHAQTTSLHVVYALLHSPGGGGGGGGGAGASSPSRSMLRDALSLARSSAYSPRLQMKALDLCFGVALDRLPSASGQRQAGEGGRDEPLVSNSLMAAIKRSQANQRRNPETFHLYQQQLQQQTAALGGASSFSTFAGVKVELQQLVLAILDDPVVSRVFGDAGFRSTDIKFAILRPPPPILRFPRDSRCPPLFLCSFSSGDRFEAALAPGRPAFPFAPAAGNLHFNGGEDNCRRIGDILARKGGGKNPMLVGFGAGEATLDFVRAVERKNWAVLPPELCGIELVNIEKAAVEFKPGNGDLSAIDSQLEELQRKTKTPGVVLNIGDLKAMVEGNVESEERERSLVLEVTRLLEVYHGRLWVMGWSATYETYMKFLSRHPLLDKDWDLQLLPITSMRSSTGGPHPRPPSLTKSFVPLGGFFPAAYESKDPPMSVHPSSRCEHCNSKYEEEVSIILKRQSASVDKHDTSLPFWKCQADPLSLNNGFNAAKVKDDGTFLNAKIMELQTKWNENCQRLHHSFQKTKTDNSPGNSCAVDPCVPTSMEGACNKNSKNPDETQSQSGFGFSSAIQVGAQKFTMTSQSISLPSVMEPINKDVASKPPIRFSKSEQLQREGFHSHQGDDNASPSSVTSVVTDLVLGTPSKSFYKEEIPATKVQKGNLEEPSSCVPSIVTDKRNTSDVPVSSFSYTGCQDSQAKNIYPVIPTHFSNCPASTFHKSLIDSSSTGQNFDLSNYKSFYTSLVAKVGRQGEAASAVSQAIFHCKTGERRRGANRRGDIWLSFSGPDRIGKKRVAAALAELIYGSKESLICIDLSDHDSLAQANTICAQQSVTENDVQLRGKLNADRIAAELRKEPNSVVFLENLNKADLIVQNSLSQAIRTGRYPDSHGREFSINNAIFILTLGATEGQTCSQVKDCSSSFCEDTILAAQCWQMKIVLEPSRETISNCPEANKLPFASNQKHWNSQVFIRSVSSSKRKLDASDGCNSDSEKLGSAKRAGKVPKEFLDLNLPVEEIDANYDDSNSHEESEPWVAEFFDLVDATINFRPFDFDTLANSILKDISKIFYDAVGSYSSLEIDPKAMEEILAVAWSSEDPGALGNWFEKVLRRGFIEVKRKSDLSNQKNIFRLLACEDAFVEEHAPGVLLPSRIIVN